MVEQVWDERGVQDLTAIEGDVRARVGVRGETIGSEGKAAVWKVATGSMVYQYAMPKALTQYQGRGRLQ